ncbi:MAG: hypothetical protein CVT67_07910 [Actinobacteria bacterium HGW-Actinobacteria-7]|nr:MAG: hypothetical protein CVT67_07910 [Actinobacteria bacterium HGW-Actinobacteria-7]
MNRTILVVALAALGAASLMVTGCAGGTSAAEKPMGVWGYVASADNAKLEVADVQTGVNDLVVDSVLAPGDSWIVVHADENGKPGKRVGLQHVSKGESTAVKVALKNLTTSDVIVAVHADRGTPGKFDFDMMKKEMSPDRPYFVGGKELASVVAVR